LVNILRSSGVRNKVCQVFWANDGIVLLLSSATAASTHCENELQIACCVYPNVRGFRI